MCNAFPLIKNGLSIRLPWLPPENDAVDRDKPPYTVYADCYALGITIWEIFTLKQNPNKYSEMLDQVRFGWRRNQL